MCILSLISDVVFDVDVPLHLLLSQGHNFSPGFFMFCKTRQESYQKRPYHSDQVGLQNSKYIFLKLKVAASAILFTVGDCDLSPTHFNCIDVETLQKDS